MAKPKNFAKIDDVRFHIDETEFRIELDIMNDNNVWVFEQLSDKMLQHHCVYFRIDWNQFKIDMRRCVLGEGDTGNDIFKGALIEPLNYQTKDTFLNLLSSYIKNAYHAGKFSK